VDRSGLLGWLRGLRCVSVRAGGQGPSLVGGETLPGPAWWRGWSAWWDRWGLGSLDGDFWSLCGKFLPCWWVFAAPGTSSRGIWGPAIACGAGCSTTRSRQAVNDMCWCTGESPDPVATPPSGSAIAASFPWLWWWGSRVEDPEGTPQALLTHAGPTSTLKQPGDANHSRLSPQNHSRPSRANHSCPSQPNHSYPSRANHSRPCQPYHSRLHPTKPLPPRTSYRLKRLLVRDRLGDHVVVELFVDGDHVVIGFGVPRVDLGDGRLGLAHPQEHSGLDQGA
jgi:hypothetical protein